MDELVGRIAESASRTGVTIGVAESLTSGRIATALGSGEDASEWFRGSLVAYAPQVKFDALGVRPGPVNTAECACQMATGALKLLGCDLAVAATGVGGPGPDEGVPAGTVFVAIVRADDEPAVRELHLDGEPEDVIDQTARRALELVRDALIEEG